MEGYKIADKNRTAKNFTNLRWIILTMDALLLLLNYGDRTAIGVAAPFIMKDFNFTPEVWGIIISAFSFGYVPFCFLGGWASDKYGPRKIMGIAAIWWSIFTALTTVGYNFVSFLMIRIFFGFGEGPQASVTAKTIGNWFPKKQLGSALGISQATTPLGGAIATPLFVWLMILTGNWKIPFILLGVIGILFAIGWFVVVRDNPEQHPWISTIELAVIKEDVAKETPVDQGPKPTLGQCLKQPLVWIISLSFFSYAWALNTFLSWFPTYLVKTHHINIHDLAISGSIPWIAGTVGLAIGGIVSDWIGKITGKTTASRKWLTVICLLGVAAAFVPSALVTSTVGAVALMAFAVFLLYLTGAQYWAMIAETFPLSHLGGIGGFVNALANLAGIVAPIVTGTFVQRTGSWGAGFVVGAIILVIGALGLAIFGKVDNRSVPSIASNNKQM